MAPASQPVIEYALRQASLRGIPVNVVYCYEDPRAIGWHHRGGRQQDKGALRLLLSESVASMSEKYPDVHVTLRLENGPVEELVATAVLERSESTVAVVPEASAA